MPYLEAVSHNSFIGERDLAIGGLPAFLRRLQQIVTGVLPGVGIALHALVEFTTQLGADPAYGELRDVVREPPDVLLSDLIESRYGRHIAQIRQDVKAVTLSPSLARKLDD